MAPGPAQTGGHQLVESGHNAVETERLAAPTEEPEHDDKEHEEAEGDLDHPHWNEGHGDGVPEPKKSGD